MNKNIKYSPYSVLMSICSKDNPEIVKDSIESILNQTLKTDDFIIVKCGRLTDELENLLSLISLRNDSIRFVTHNPDRGLGASLNEGLKKCKNELVARMDPDDVSAPERCERQVMEFMNDNSIMIVGTEMKRFIKNINNVIGIKKMPSTFEEIYKYGKRGNPYCHPTVMYKKSMVVKQGGYLEVRKSEDFEFFTRITSNHVKGMNISEPLHFFRMDENQYKRRTSWKETKSIIAVEYKNYKKRYASFIDLMVVVITRVGGMVVPYKLGEKIVNLMDKKIVKFI